MRRIKPNDLLLAMLFLFALLNICSAQEATKIGFPENGLFDGDEFESVHMPNANLHIEIPLWSSKGRGLDMDFKMVYDAQGWYIKEHCDRYGYCTDYVAKEDFNHLILQAVGPFSLGATGPSVYANCNNVQYLITSGRFLHTPDGTAHHLIPDPAIAGGNACWGDLNGPAYADDGSGWMVKNGIYSKNGIMFAGIANTCNSKLEDPNGNQLLLQSDCYVSSGTDTLGRSVDLTGLTYYDSSGTLQTIQVTYVNVPLHTHLFSLCGADACNEYSGTWSVPQVITLPNAMKYTFTYAQNDYAEPLSVTLPTGGQISWGWGGGTDEGPGLTSRSLYDNITGTTATWTYTGNSITDPNGNQTTYGLTLLKPGFRDTYYYVGCASGGPCSPYVTSMKYYAGSAASGTLLKTVQTDYSTTGSVIPIRETTTLNDSNLVTKTETDYDSFNVWSGAITWKNPIEVRDYDYGTGAPGALLRKTDYAYLHQSNAAYRNLNIADRPTSKTIKNGSGTTVAQTLTYYDDPNGSYTYMVADLGGAPNHDASRGTSYLTRGNATRVSRWLNSPSSYFTTQNQYDDLGNLRATTDPKGNTTTFGYGDNFNGSVATCIPSGVNTQAFVTATVNALSQGFYTGYYGCQGLISAKQDPNDVVAHRQTGYTYDSMNRPSTVNYADGGQTNYGYQDTAPVMVVEARVQDSAHNVYSWTQVDGLGRVNRTASSNGEANLNIMIDQVDTCYDALGRKSFVTYPYQGPGWANNAYSCTNSTSSPGDTYSYDALGRVTKVTNTDGSILTNTYSGNTTIVTDQAGKSRESQTDALGRLTTVWEDPYANAFRTNYQYDALDNLTRVDQLGGTTDSTQWRTRLFTYDSFSRLLTASNPESGTTAYSYDANGNLISKTAPAANQTGTATTTTVYSYDALNRLTLRCFWVGCNSGVLHDGYVYDLSTSNGYTVHNPIGRLVLTASNNPVSGTNGNVVTVHSYDSMGRIEFQIEDPNRVTSIFQQFKYVYNLDGSLKSIQYPSGRIISYSYPLSGTSNCPACGSERPISAIDSANGVNYVTNAHYTAWGALSSLVNGTTPTFTGITTSNSFNARMQPQTLSASSPTSSIFSLTYNFNLGAGDNGNVIGFTNNRDTTRSQSFTYDYLNRLSSAQSSATSGNNCWGNSFGYDPWANLLSKTVTKCTSEALSVSVGPNNRLNSTGFAYDAAGNLAANGSATYAYDAENRLTSAPGVTFDYDADGRRVQKSNGKLYWYGTNDEVLQETDLAGNLQKEFIFFGGERIAWRDASLNFISNGGFENGFTNWTSGETYQVITDATRAHSGNSYLQLSASTSASCQYGTEMPVTPGQVLHFGGWVYRESGNGYARWELTAYDANQNPVGYPGSFNAGTGDWEFQEASYTVAAGVAYVRLHCDIYQATMPSVVRFDDGFLGGDVHYYFSDHLGSSSVIANSTGGVESESDYFPFGGERVITNTGNGNTYKFTGKERDTETGLDEFGARYYSSALGRFTIPDWAAKPTSVPYAKFGDPQTLNLYSYVENAPVNRADADGHCPDGCPIDYPQTLADLDRQNQANADFAAGFGKGVVNFATSSENAFLTMGESAQGPIPQFKPSNDIQAIGMFIGNLASMANSFLAEAPATSTVQRNATRGPYSEIPNPGNVGPDRPFSQAQKAQIYDANLAKNGGVLKSDQSGQGLVRPSKSQAGITPPSNEAQVDHITPRKPNDPTVSPGTNSNTNAQVLSRTENQVKSNKIRPN